MNILLNAWFSIEESPSLFPQFIKSSVVQIQFLVKLDCKQSSQIMGVKNNWHNQKVQQTGGEEGVESRNEEDE